MKKINELNININKAIVTEVTLSLEENGLSVNVIGGLFTDQGKKVSNFNFSTKKYSWDSDNDIEIPMSLNFPAKEIFETLTPIIYEKLNGAFQAIKDKNE